MASVSDAWLRGQQASANAYMQQAALQQGLIGGGGLYGLAYQSQQAMPEIYGDPRHIIEPVTLNKNLVETLQEDFDEWVKDIKL
jgi:hypothetical protein